VRRHLVPSVISRGGLCQATSETSVSEERNRARNVRIIQPIICDFHGTTWDKQLYFPSEERHAKDFFTRKIRRLRPGANPRSWVPEVSMLTIRPPKVPEVSMLTTGPLKPLKSRVKQLMFLGRNPDCGPGSKIQTFRMIDGNH
jgi:hypothetical protein